jgi:hypothetical protein
MIKQDLAKAVQALDVAKLLIEAGAIDDAVNRTYYSAFHTARALVGLANPELSSKSHKGVLTAFSNLYVRTGKLPKEYGSKINRAQSARQVADYEEHSILIDEAAEHIDFAQDILNRALELIPAAEHPVSRAISLTDALKDEAAERALAVAFCELAEKRGESLPPGFAEELTLYGDVERLTQLIADVDAMTDLKSYVQKTIPTPSLD